jgi:hypothetical protein
MTITLWSVLFLIVIFCLPSHSLTLTFAFDLYHNSLLFFQYNEDTNLIDNNLCLLLCPKNSCFEVYHILFLVEHSTQWTTIFTSRSVFILICINCFPTNPRENYSVER